MKFVTCRVMCKLLCGRCPVLCKDRVIRKVFEICAARRKAQKPRGEKADSGVLMGLPFVRIYI